MKRHSLSSGPGTREPWGVAPMGADCSTAAAVSWSLLDEQVKQFLRINGVELGHDVVSFDTWSGRRLREAFELRPE